MILLLNARIMTEDYKGNEASEVTLRGDDMTVGMLQIAAVGIVGQLIASAALKAQIARDNKLSEEAADKEVKPTVQASEEEVPL